MGKVISCPIATQSTIPVVAYVLTHAWVFLPLVVVVCCYSDRGVSLDFGCRVPYQLTQVVIGGGRGYFYSKQNLILNINLLAQFTYTFIYRYLRNVMSTFLRF